VAESIGAIAVFALIREGLGRPAGIPELVRRYLPSGSIGLSSFALLVGAFFLLKNLAISLAADRQSRLVASSMEHTFTRLHHAYLSAPFARHLVEKSAALIRTLQQSIDFAFRVGMTAAAGIVAESLVVLGLCLVLILEAPLPALGAFALFSAVLAGFSLATG